MLDIALMGHPVLRAAAQAIEDPTAPWVRRLADDMIETMAAAGGTGLAAPQVKDPWRLVVFRVDADRLSGMANDFPVDLTVLVNPIVEPVGRERALHPGRSARKAARSIGWRCNSSRKTRSRRSVIRCG